MATWDDIGRLRDGERRAYWAERRDRLEAMPAGAFTGRLEARALEELHAELVEQGRTILAAASASRSSTEAQGRSFAEKCAHKFCAIMAETPGAPRCNVWIKPGIVRVYFPSKDYLSVGQDGSLSDRERGKVTFLPSNLYASQRKAFGAAKGRYLEWVQQDREEKLAMRKNGAASLMMPVTWRQLRGLWSNKGNFVVDIHPKTFLELTTRDSKHLKEIREKTKPLKDWLDQDVQRDITVLPFLDIMQESGKVRQHEGRHRAAAVLNAGGERFRIGVYLRPADREWSIGDLPDVWSSQFDGVEFYVSRLLDAGLMCIVNDQIQSDFALLQDLQDDDDAKAEELQSALRKQLCIE